MATEAADPRAFESWEDAFQYPVPTIRGMEKKLRGTVEDNREKLRSLVGSSYRDLLGTARTIVDVHDQMQHVESLLAHASKKSDSRVFDKLGRNYVRFERAQAAKDQDRNTRVSQTRVLQASFNSINQLLRLNSSTLLAAKLLVVARLLHKNLSEHTTVESEGRRLASLRVKLRSKIDRRLQQGGVEPTVLTEDLTAFALAFSASPSEVLTHFLHMRSESIKQAPQDSTGNERSHVLSKIRLYFNTLQDSRSIFPDVLRASLRALGSKPILKDERIQRMDALNLDIHKDWFRDEVKNYVPWTRSEELTRDKAKEISSQQARNTFTILLHSIEASVAQIDDFEVLTNLRRSVLQEWLSLRRGGNASSAFQDVEQLSLPFQSRLSAVVKSHCSSFYELVIKSIEDALHNSGTQTDDKGTLLWSQDILDLDAANGASAFRKAVINGRLGKTADTYRILSEVEKGTGVIEKMRATIKSMQGNRWDDDLEEEEFESESATNLSTTLSNQQPTELRDMLDDSAQTCWHDLQDRLTKSVGDGRLQGDNSADVALTTMRTIRELQPQLSVLWAKDDSTAPSFCKPLYETCITTVTTPIAGESLSVLTKSLAAFVSANRRIDALWEGKPPLPSQPSPAAFKYLRAVTRSMQSVGSDVWATEAVASLKSNLEGDMAKEVQKAVEKLETSASETAESEPPEESLQDKSSEPQVATSENKDGDAAEEASAPAEETYTEEKEGDKPEEAKEVNEKPPKNIQKREKALQLLFDTIYLQQACSSKGGEEKSIAQATAKLQGMADLDDASSARIRKSASDYWKRTYLLFGLLLGSQQ